MYNYLQAIAIKLDDKIQCQFQGKTHKGKVIGTKTTTQGEFEFLLETPDGKYWIDVTTNNFKKLKIKAIS
jgi:hypothetical protein